MPDWLGIARSWAKFIGYYLLLIPYVVVLFLLMYLSAFAGWILMGLSVWGLYEHWTTNPLGVGGTAYDAISLGLLVGVVAFYFVGVAMDEIWEMKYEELKDDDSTNWPSFTAVAKASIQNLGSGDKNS